jgi:hypothetical protein
MPNRRARRPLNPTARDAANESLYSAHAGDPRPNPLFDEEGNRQPIDPNDPAQAGLRSEWMDAYIANGGAVEGDEGTPDSEEANGADDPAETCPLDDSEPDIQCTWVPTETFPDHNPTTGLGAMATRANIREYPFELEQLDPAIPATDIKLAPPADATFSPQVTTTNVPDGTTASITVRRCDTNDAVTDGSLTGLEVRSSRVVRPSTNDLPKLTMRAEQDPYRVWNRPFFYFATNVAYRGLSCETPRDYQADPGTCLRVKYRHSSIGYIGDTIASSVQTKTQFVKDFLDGIAHSLADRQLFPSYAHSEAAFGSYFRNTYCVFSDSHGTLVKTDGTNSFAPPHDYSEPPSWPRSQWRSVVCFSTKRFIDAADVNNADRFISVPKYLYYISACLSGWEPSLANAFISRGCRHVIAYRKVIYTNKGEQMARAFFNSWANSFNLDPDKIPDAFATARTGLESDLRPMLYPTNASTSGGLSSAAIAGIVIAAIAVVAVGVVVGMAIAGLF